MLRLSRAQRWCKPSVFRVLDRTKPKYGQKSACLRFPGLPKGQGNMLGCTRPESRGRHCSRARARQNVAPMTHRSSTLRKEMDCGERAWSPTAGDQLCRLGAELLTVAGFAQL